MTNEKPVCSKKSATKIIFNLSRRILHPYYVKIKHYAYYGNISICEAMRVIHTECIIKKKVVFFGLYI